MQLAKLLTTRNSFASMHFMNLQNFLLSNTQASLALSLGVSQGLVHQWAKGLRPVSPQQCVAIEKATNGAVTRKDLRPDDWQLIWPELADKDAA